jgi:hypothetical protein
MGVTHCGDLAVSAPQPDGSTATGQQDHSDRLELTTEIKIAR